MARCKRLGQTGVVLLLMGGCARGATLEDRYETADAADASGSDGSCMGAESDGVESVGEACCTASELACAGHAQKLVVICDAATMQWLAFEACTGQMLCDTQAGMNQGSCQPVEPLCVGSSPGDRVCDGNASVECGPDLVTSIETACTYACESGACTGNCMPQERRCDGKTPQVCDSSGTWQSEASCTYVCSGQGECAGQCTPGLKQCEGKTPQVCDNDGKWGSGSECPVLCSAGECAAECTPNAKQCSGQVPQTCNGSGSAWEDGTACEYVCNAGSCLGSCTPGDKRCVGSVPQTCDASGEWNSGTACQYVCSAGTCSGGCTPGTSECQGLTPRTCSANGQWQSGTPCAYVCSGAGVCNGECSPGDKGCEGSVPRTCDGSGQWQNETPCPYTCTAGTCTGSCTPNAMRCNGLVQQTCSASGQWEDGSACPYGCSGAGVCSGECVPTSTDCSGQTPRTCNASGQWVAGTTCSGSTPVCSGGQCVALSPTGPSCTGLAATCGPNNDANCCASTVIPGGTFNRSNDASSPATVSDFRMDVYELTVGRFRKFVEAGKGTQEDPPLDESGANANLSGSGWQSGWNTLLEANKGALVAKLKCNSSLETWTDSAGANENRPLNCVNWYEAFAFCIWDGGRLATEAEWNYAAAGGSEQREYPWSVPATSKTIDCTYAAYSGCAGDALNVGSHSTKGDGKWGQADLAGNLWEWVLDWNADYSNPCYDCAKLTGSSFRGIRGGSFDGSESYLLSSYRSYRTPLSRYSNRGARCVRNAP